MFCQWMCRLYYFSEPKDVHELRACEMTVHRLKGRFTTKKDTTFKSLT
jgi:hypothetical protein